MLSFFQDKKSQKLNIATVSSDFNNNTNFASGGHFHLQNNIWTLHDFPMAKQMNCTFVLSDSTIVTSLNSILPDFSNDMSLDLHALKLWGFFCCHYYPLTLSIFKFVRFMTFLKDIILPFSKQLTILPNSLKPLVDLSNSAL